MNPSSGDGRNYWGSLIVGGVTFVTCAHVLVVQHNKEEARRSEVREETAQSILRVAHPEPNDKHTHQEEYSTESARDNVVEINTSGDAQFTVMQDFLAGKSAIEVGGRKFFIPAT